MKAALSIILLFFISTSFQALKQSKITIIVTTPALQDSQIYITGNHDNLGNWNPGKIPLSKQNNKWIGEFYFEDSTELQFKFTLGTWSTESLNDDGTVPPNYAVKITRDTTLNYYIAKWKDGKTEVIKSTITGNLIYHHKFTSKKVMERDIVIWLPPSYMTDNEKRYPVLYVHDGQNVFDASTSSYGSEWRLDEITDSLIKSNSIEEIIIVAINNTLYRSSEYSYGERGHNYIDFITNELKPFIDSTYRTLPGRENTATLGASMGGLISLILLWEKTEVFSMAACFSPAFKIDDIDYTPWIKSYPGNKKNIKLFISNGGKGIEAQLLPGVRTTINILKEKNYADNIETYFDENAGHNEKDWSLIVHKPLILFFKKK